MNAPQTPASQPKKKPKRKAKAKVFDLATRWGRFKTYWDYWWADHAFLRLGFQNAFWIGPDMVRSNQPWPFQLARWKRMGIKTIVNLRGGFDASFYALEKHACDRLGLKMVDFTITSREAPKAEKVLAAKELFQSIEYPALMHCKRSEEHTSELQSH